MKETKSWTCIVDGLERSVNVVTYSDFCSYRIERKKMLLSRTPLTRSMDNTYIQIRVCLNTGETNDGELWGLREVKGL